MAPMIITILGWIVCISAGYLFFAVLVPFLIIPNISYFKIKIRKNERLKEFSKRFKSRNKEKTLRNVYNYIIKNYKGVEKRHKVILLPYKAFYYKIEDILSKRQFLHCNVQNRILITLLVNTEQFKERNFERRLEITNFGTSHQYLIVKINGKKFKVDPFFRIFEEIE